VLSAIYRSDGELVHLVAHDHFSPESVAAVRVRARRHSLPHLRVEVE
jgi:hypothetical protein